MERNKLYALPNITVLNSGIMSYGEGVCSMHGRDEEYIQNFLVENTEGKILYRRHRRSWDGNISLMTTKSLTRRGEPLLRT